MENLTKAQWIRVAILFGVVAGATVLITYLK